MKSRGIRTLSSKLINSHIGHVPIYGLSGRDHDVGDPFITLMQELRGVRCGFRGGDRFKRDRRWWF